jgi:glucosamine-6-phosphate deaminase
MDFITTVKGSMLENFYPAGWDMAKIDACCSIPSGRVLDRMDFWNKGFDPVSCETLSDFDTYMGHEIAMQIKKARDEGRKIVMILPVGPMGMYRWAVFFLKEWKEKCDHMYGLNMDEWSDSEGNTLSSEDPAAFQNAMENAFYGPLGELGVPKKQRNFATKDNLPQYPAKMAELRKEGAKQVLVFGIGRMCHIAFWEPHFAGEFNSVDEWRKQTHRLGAKLHPLTIEQNALTSFKSRTTLVPCRANTIGPGLFMNSEYIIGGCDGTLGRGMQWQGMSFWITLRYGPDMWFPSTFMPTLPGKLFFLKELAGPLAAECN